MFLTYAFEIPMEIDDFMPFQPFLWGSISGDFTELHNSLLDFASKHGEDGGYGYYYVNSEVFAEKADIKVNGFKAKDLTVSYDGTSFEMLTTAEDIGFNPHTAAYLDSYDTSSLGFGHAIYENAFQLEMSASDQIGYDEGQAVGDYASTYDIIRTVAINYGTEENGIVYMGEDDATKYFNITFNGERVIAISVEDEYNTIYFGFARDMDASLSKTNLWCQIYNGI